MEERKLRMRYSALCFLRQPPFSQPLYTRPFPRCPRAPCCQGKDPSAMQELYQSWMGAISLLYPLYLGKLSLWKDRVSNILWSVVFPYKVLHQPLCNTSLKVASLGRSKGLLQGFGPRPVGPGFPGRFPGPPRSDADWIPGERGPPLRGERDWIPPPGHGDRDWIPPRSVASMVSPGAPPQGRPLPPPAGSLTFVQCFEFLQFSFYIYLQLIMWLTIVSIEDPWCTKFQIHWCMVGSIYF